MISLSLRSIVRSGSWTSSSSSSRARTSCWVIVEAPRLFAADRVEARGDDADRIEPGVLPEGLVLDGRRGVEDDRRDLVEGDDLALVVAEAGQLDLAGAVVDDRLLGQDVLGQLRGRSEVRGERVVDPDGGHGADDTDAGQEHEHDDRDRRDDGSATTLGGSAGSRSGLAAGGVGHGSVWSPGPGG